jgi:integrase
MYWASLSFACPATVQTHAHLCARFPPTPCYQSRARSISQYRAVEVLKRLHARQLDICDLSFETTFAERVPHKLFRFSDGYQPPSLNGTFRRLMRDTGLLKNEDGQNRTLYSLRHTYATFELLRGGTDIHTLSKQMGNSAAMIERHYSKLTATMAADKLA